MILENSGCVQGIVTGILDTKMTKTISIGHYDSEERGKVDQIQVMYLWQEYQGSEAVFFQ